jgi:hypothetical protein
VAKNAVNRNTKNRLARAVLPLLIDADRASGAIVFRSPRGAEVEIGFYNYEDSASRNQAYVVVNGVLITPVRMSDTAELTDATLRGLVETAITDAMAAEVRLDPTGRHGAQVQKYGEDAKSVAERGRVLRDL